MTLLDDLPKLREMEQKATCASWYKAERDEGDCDEINGRLQSWDTGIMVYDRELGVFHPEQVKLRCGPEEFEDEYNMESICSPEKEQDADLIAALRNAAPAMLDVLGMIREGDAGELELIYHILERGFIDPTAMRGYRRADQRGMLECIQRHAKMAALMEKEEREG